MMKYILLINYYLFSLQYTLPSFHMLSQQSLEQFTYYSYSNINSYNSITYYLYASFNYTLFSYFTYHLFHGFAYHLFYYYESFLDEFPHNLLPFMSLCKSIQF